MATCDVSKKRPSLLSNDRYGPLDIYSDDPANCQLDFPAHNASSIFGGTLNSILGILINMLGVNSNDSGNDSDKLHQLLHTFLVSFPRFIEVEAIFLRLKHVVTGRDDSREVRVLRSRGAIKMIEIWMEKYVQVGYFPPHELLATINNVAEIADAVTADMREIDCQSLSSIQRKVIERINRKRFELDIPWRTQLVEGRYLDPSTNSGRPDIQVFGLSNTDFDPSAGTLYQPPQPRIDVGTNLLQRYKNFMIWSFSTMEIARQLTLIDHKLFLKIPVHELYDKAWSEPRSSHVADNLRSFIDHFNALSTWVTSSVLDAQTSRDGVAIYIRMVELADYLFKLGDLSGAMAVVSGLHKNVITRLKRLHEMVPGQKVEVLTRISQEMSPEKSYKAYRAKLQSLEKKLDSPESVKMGASAIVPHMAIHLGDLIMVEDMNENFIPGSNKHMLNISKWELFAFSISTLVNLQQKKYRLEPVRVLACLINKELSSFYHCGEEESERVAEDMVRRSRTIEPLDLTLDILTMASSPDGSDADSPLGKAKKKSISPRELLRKVSLNMGFRKDDALSPTISSSSIRLSETLDTKSRSNIS